METLRIKVRSVVSINGGPRPSRSDFLSYCQGSITSGFLHCRIHPYLILCYRLPVDSSRRSSYFSTVCLVWMITQVKLFLGPAKHRFLLCTNSPLELAETMEVYKDASRVLASAATIRYLVISNHLWVHVLLPHIPPHLVSQRLGTCTCLGGRWSGGMCYSLPGNYRLESNPVRHDLSPLAAATGNRISRARVPLAKKSR